MANMMNRMGMRPQLPTIRTPTGMQNAPFAGAPPNPGAPMRMGADPFNRPLTATPGGPLPASGARPMRAPMPTMTPAGNVGAAGPVGPASVPVAPLPPAEGAKPMMPPMPMPMRPMGR